MKKNIFILIAICANMGNLFCSQSSATKLTASEKKILKLQELLNRNEFTVNPKLTLSDNTYKLIKDFKLKIHYNMVIDMLKK